LRSLFAILAMMTALFFVIPHGEAIEKGSTFPAQKTNETVTGFSNEINLQNVSGISKDTSKKIVVSGIGENRAEELRTYHWRGNRYTKFLADKWENPEFTAQKNIAVSASGSANIQGLGWNSLTRNHDVGSGSTLGRWEDLENLRVTYYTLGTQNLFFPKTPYSLSFPNRSGFANLTVSRKDDSLFSLTPAPNVPVTLDIAIKRSTSTNKLSDASTSFTPFQIEIEPATEKLFRKFWDSIDPKLQKNPS
jgi:hypothetical protein